MLKYRLASAVVLIPLIVGSVILGGPIYFILVSAMILIGGYEFFQMARHAGFPANLIIGLTLIALILLDAASGGAWASIILTTGMVFSLFVAIFRRSDKWILGWALTFAGVVYVGILGAHFILVRQLPQGALWTMLVLLPAWATDTAAFISGRLWGRHGFFTSISPKKTWEGAIGGEIAAIVVSLALGWVAAVPLVHALLLGTGVGIAATVGDLAESMLKRQLGAKDSGVIVPGHGGLLDREDSLLFAAVFGYYYLIWILRV